MEFNEQLEYLQKKWEDNLPEVSSTKLKSLSRVC